MTLLILSYLGGVLTILSPCILPVLPFIFARADRSFLSNGLPLLLGMAVTFAGVATLAAIGGGWVVSANQYGRLVAMIILGLLGVALLFPSLADRLARPLVAFGGRLSSAADERDSRSAIFAAFLLGVATGFLWAPCTGPILGLVLTGAALSGASVQSAVLLLAYAAGAATSLAVVLLAGGRLIALLKRSLGVGEWVRRGLGLAVLAGVVAIAFGLDAGLLTRLSLAGTSALETKLIDQVRPKSGIAMAGKGTLPDLSGAVGWLNSPPLTRESLRGKVVLVDFWTYSCINCLRSLPYIRAWAAKYKDHGLVVIGVHAPEFAFERDAANVKQAVQTLGIDYPVAIDNNYAIWRGFNNQYWPAHYFVDGTGHIRDHHFGEGDYENSELVIRKLLEEAGNKDLPSEPVSVTASGAEAAADTNDIQSPETYIGYQRAERFAATGQFHDLQHDYAAPGDLALNQWAVAGIWTVTADKAVLMGGRGRIVYRFHARDLHLVLGPRSDGTPIHFRVLIDGAAPGKDHGVDVNEAGEGSVVEQRLYQLVRQSSEVRDRVFEIEFLDPGVQAHSFTFG